MIQSTQVMVSGKTIMAVIDVASALSGGDPRPVLLAALATATLLGAGVELEQVPGVMEKLATMVSKAAAEGCETLLDEAGIRDDFGGLDGLLNTEDKPAA